MYNTKRIASARKTNGQLQEAVRRRLSENYGKVSEETIYQPKPRKGV